MVKIYGIDIQDVDELIFGDDERVRAGDLQRAVRSRMTEATPKGVDFCFL